MRDLQAISPTLTAMLGTPVTDRHGQLRGRVKDLAVGTGADAGKVAGLVLKTRKGSELVPATGLRQTPSGALELRHDAELQPLRAGTAPARAGKAAARTGTAA